MANDVFDIRQNLSIEFYIPDAGTFVWGVNYWDDGGVWDTDPSSLGWKNLTCETFDISLTSGCAIESGIFTAPSSSIAQIRMQGASYDPFASGVIHAGTGVRIKIEPLPDSDPGSTYTIWQGTVRDFSASYNQQGNNIISINAVDAMQTFLNTFVAGYTIVTMTSLPGTVIADLAALYYPGSFTPNINPDISSSYLAGKVYANTTVGAIINDCLTAGLGALWMDREGTLQYRSQDDLENIIDTFSFEFSTIHSTDPVHICMTDLVMKADSRDLPNEIVTTISTGAQGYLRNQDSYDLYGPIALDVDLPFDSALSATRWRNALDLTTKLRRVESLSFDAISRPGQLWEWYQVDRIFDPNIITYDINGISFSEYYFVTQQQDHITPNSWDITLELWRGI
jgi:hypothetical protein